LNSEKSMRSAPKSVKTQRRQDRRFQIISIVFLAIVAFFQTFPFWIKLIDATHSPEFLPEIGKVYIWFADFTLVNFKTVIESARLFQALGVSLLHTVSFTGLSLFVAVLDMGVAGAAIATIASQFFSAILTLIALLRTQDSYRLIVSKIRFHRDLLFDIIKIGLPAGLQSAMYSISNLLIQSSINSFGTDTIAAWTAYGKVDSIFWMIMGAYGVSITTFAGQNFGAGKYDRIKKSVRICLGLAAVTSLFLSFIVLNFGGTILLLFTRDANVINICIGMMRVVSPAYITYICIEILSGTCRGCGDSFFPMLLTCFGVCVLRILWITIAVPLRHEVATVAFSYPLTWTITSILFILYYKRGKWMQKDTLRNAPQGQGKDA